MPKKAIPGARPPDRKWGDVPIVGIGASAGGVEALKRFFGAMPPNSGIAFVIVMHLEPTHASALGEILSRCTSMRVVTVEDGMPIERNRIYVIPPDAYLTIRGRRLYLKRPPPRDAVRRPVDAFLRSLAQDCGERAACVILSGSGNDGTAGVRVVKAAGGLAIVQDPSTAGSDGMPRSVVETGLADFVVTIEEMPDLLNRHARHWAVPSIRDSDELDAILALLRARTRHDFRCYKKNTLRRRIDRRMAILQCEEPADYLRLLQSNPNEVRALVRDLLIGVTRFFREPEGFEKLRTLAIERLIAGREGGRPLRVWVPGCATGEEAYSIAMLAEEAIVAAGKPLALQIFATDVEPDALEFARAGVYPKAVTEQVRSQRLARFFTPVEHGYRVNKAIRERVVFAEHNLLKDPPFLRVDLISCRNLLIYFEQEVQRRIIEVFQFALNTEGFLFLGTSESIDLQSGMFRAVSKRWRIFQRLDRPSRRPSSFPIAPPLRSPGMAGGLSTQEAAQRNLAELTRKLLLEHHDSAGVLINRKAEILQLHGNAGKYLELPSGEPRLELFAMVREGLWPKLRVAVAKAIREEAVVVVPKLRFRRDGRDSLVTVTVKPVRSAEGLYLVIFEPSGDSGRPPVRLPAPTPSRGRRDLVAQLQSDLRVAKDDLRSTVEELEASNEELKAANEEVMSTNEELKSTNEELETSKEELQSVNEELNTLNAQLVEKVHELTEANNDLSNLLGTTDVATIFLDTSLRVKRFTPAATKLFHLIPSDVGRPIQHLTSNVVGVDLVQEVEAFLRDPAPVRKEVRDRAGGWYVLRLFPYRTAENAVEGVVVMFVDVKDFKEQEGHLRALLRSQAFVATLGRKALAHSDVGDFLDETVQGLIGTLGVEVADVLAVAAGGMLDVRASAGWRAEEAAKLAASEGTPAAAVLRTASPVLVEDFASDARFRDLEPFRSRKIVSGLGVPILGEGGSCGVVEVFSVRKRPFSGDEVNFLQAVANVIGGAIRHRESHGNLEASVKERTEWLEILAEVAVTANEAVTVDQPFSVTLRRLCAYGGFRVGHLYEPQAQAPERVVLANSWEEGDGEAARRLDLGTSTLLRRVLASGEAEWGSDLREGLGEVQAKVASDLGLRSAVAFPIRIGRATVAVAVCLSDRALAPDERLLAVLTNVGTQLGRVEERARSQQNVVEAIWREAKLGQELHDGLGQQLTGLSFMTKSLERRLKGKEAESARELGEGMRKAVEYLRAISKGMQPVERDPEGLMAALKNLAAGIEPIYSVPCRFECRKPVLVANAGVATHLYRIAQEAVTNAVKHAHPKRISIRLQEEGGRVTLTVRDDGRGIGGGANRDGGMGMRIMRHRAVQIGGVLKVASTPGGGTTISCSLPRGAAGAEEKEEKK